MSILSVLTIRSHIAHLYSNNMGNKHTRINKGAVYPNIAALVIVKTIIHIVLGFKRGGSCQQCSKTAPLILTLM